MNSHNSLNGVVTHYARVLTNEIFRHFLSVVPCTVQHDARLPAELSWLGQFSMVELKKEISDSIKTSHDFLTVSHFAQFFHFCSSDLLYQPN